MAAALLALAAFALPRPQPVAADSAVGDVVYVIEAPSNVASYDAATGERLRLVHTGVAGLSPLAVVAGPNGLIFVATDEGILRFSAATGEPAGALWNTEGFFARSLAFAPDGTLYVLAVRRFDLRASRILRFDPDDGALLGVVVDKLDTAYPAPGQPPLVNPMQIEFGPDGDLYLLDDTANLLVRFDPRSGAFRSTVIPKDERIFYNSAFTFGPDRAIYLSEGLLPALTNKPTKLFRYSPSGQLQSVFAEVPWPFGLRFGPGGDLFVASNDSLLRLDGRTGKLLATVVARGIGGGRQSFTFARAAARAERPAVNPAFVTVAQRSSPALQARRGDTVTLTLTARNSGRGGARNVTVTLPTDPARLKVLDAAFSSQGGWVSELRPDALTLQTGPLASGGAVTATLRLAVANDAPYGPALTAPPRYSWRDGAGGGSGVANAPPLAVADERRDAPFLPAEVRPLSAPAGAARAYSLSHMLPGEPVALWYTTPGGGAVAIGRATASAGGAAAGELATTGLAPGWYALAAQGLWSGLTAASGFEVR